MVDYLKIRIDSKFYQFIVKSFVAECKIDDNETLYYFWRKRFLNMIPTSCTKSSNLLIW